MVFKIVEPIEPRNRLPLVWYDDIEAVIDTKSLIEDILSPGAFSVLYGESNCGKTFLALDMALRIAHGQPWFGRKTMQGAVIYVAAEAGKNIYNRIAAFKLGNDTMESDGPVPFAVIPTQVDLLDPNGDRLELANKIREVSSQTNDVLLVVIDTLSRAIAGGEENSSEDMGAFVRNIDAVREMTGAHVMVIHHSGKDASKGARGHSLLRAAADHELEVTHDENTSLRILHIRKQRDMPAGGEFPFRLNSIALGVNPEGNDVTSCVVTDASRDVTLDEIRTRSSLPEKPRMALEKLDDLLSREGQKAPGSNHIPPHVTVVKIETFREHLKNTGVTDRDKPDNERAQWGRIKDKLLSAKRITIWQDFMWKLP